MTGLPDGRYVHFEPSEKYSLAIRFLLVRDGCAVQFVFRIMTKIDRPVRPGHELIFEPMAFDMGYHSPHPMYDGQTLLWESPCEFIGVPCYYDGSGLYAEEVLQKLYAGGHDAVWAELEEYWDRMFGGVG